MFIQPRVALSVLVAGGIAAGAQAQSKPPFSGLLPHATIPSDHSPYLTSKTKTLVDGASFVTWFPFSLGMARQMAVYESRDLDIARGKLITHLGFQAEPGFESKGCRVSLEVQMGRSKRTATTASAKFDENFAASPSKVFGGVSGRDLDLPDLGDSLDPNPDRPFVWVPLSTGYVHDDRSNLAVDYRVHANSNATARFAYCLDVARPVAPVRDMGGGCVDSSGYIPYLRSRPALLGDPWILTLSRAAPSARTGLGVSFEAGSGPELVWKRRADCMMHLVPPLLYGGFLPGTTSRSGRCRWLLPIPDDVRLKGVTLYAQSFVEDLLARHDTSLSNAVRAQIGMRPRMTIITHQGDPNMAQLGTVCRNLGVISHFRTN